MRKPDQASFFEFVPHTADIAVRLTAPTPASLFAVAAVALTETMTNHASIHPVAARTIELSAPELDLLLVEWLDELLFVFETEAFLVHDASVDIDAPVHAEGNHVLRATVRGEPRDAALHPLKVLVKATTYHGLRIQQTPRGYEATVIFDI